MAKVGYGPKDFDPRDYRAATEKLFAFLETLEHRYLAPPMAIPPHLVEWVIDEVDEVVAAAYMVAEFGPPDFPTLAFVSRIVFQLDEIRKVRDAYLDESAPHENGVVPSMDYFERQASLRAAWTAIHAAYPEFRAPLKLLELRAKHVPEAPTEVATDSQRPAARRKPGRATKDIPLHVSDALLKRWEDLDDNAPKQIAWAAEAARWLRDEHNSTAPDGELWNPEEVIRFLKNAQERVGRPLRKRD